VAGGWAVAAGGVAASGSGWDWASAVAVIVQSHVADIPARQSNLVFVSIGWPSYYDGVSPCNS